MLELVYSRSWKIAAICLGLAFTQAACGQTAPAAATCPSGNHATIDRANFMQLDGIQFIGQSADAEALGRQLTEADLGSVHAHIRCMLSDLSFQSPYTTPRNGDAAFIPPGTAVYTVKGYAPYFRLAVHNQGRIELFEADQNPWARHGGDLLDLAGKVSYITVNSDDSGAAQIVSIRDPAVVSALVTETAYSPVSTNLPGQGFTGAHNMIVYHLNDGTVVARGYWVDTGLMAGNILLPAQFQATIRQALDSKKP
jgi:hypothetical protein